MTIIFLLIFFALAFVFLSAIAVFAFRKDTVSKEKIFLLGSSVFRNLNTYVREEKMVLIHILVCLGVILWLAAIIMIVVKSVLN